MLQIIAVMLAGLFVGWLFRSRRLHFISHIITVLILLLLFFLGVEIGHSDEVMSTLPTLGIKAVVIGAFAMMGSVLLAWCLYRWHLRKKGKEQDER